MRFFTKQRGKELKFPKRKSKFSGKITRDDIDEAVDQYLKDGGKIKREVIKNFSSTPCVYWVWDDNRDDSQIETAQEHRDWDDFKPNSWGY